ncbi:MAG: MmcQ/YjbR family DNA-binding protein [Treponema sp.]|jgi:predicted DNA-binding protein (MmcQ/YjbR family)|nr:MmcQ/YjbR family DNA-binding protein [Treponema sp.]
MSKRTDIFKYVKRKYRTDPDYPFMKFPDYAVLRHSKNKKWYGVIMNVPNDKLGITGDGSSEAINVKCYPEIIGDLRTDKGILPAYHMNRDHWITILLGGAVRDEKIYQLLDMSYELTE